MKLLQEYLDIAICDRESLFEAITLLEDLGNFKKIRPDFLSIFKTSKTIQKTGDYAREVFGAGGLRKGVGRNSEFTSTLVKNGGAVADAMKEPGAVGFVITTGETVNDQVFAALFTYKDVSGNTGEIDHTNSKVLMVLDKDYLKTNNPEAFEKMKNNSDFVDNASSAVQVYERSITLAKARTFITAVIKAVKQADGNAKLIIISNDTDRAIKNKNRQSARVGKVLTPKEYSKLSEKDLTLYAGSFKRALKTRLDKYKSGKAIDVKSADEFFNTIVEKGYIDKIKLNGITYKYVNANINFNSLKDGVNDSFYSSAVEYRIEEDDRFNWSSSGEKIKTQYQKLMDLAGEESGYFAVRDKMEADKKAGVANSISEEEWDKASDAFAKACPPSNIFIKFKLQGASIVPDHIEFKRY